MLQLFQILEVTLYVIIDLQQNITGVFNEKFPPRYNEVPNNNSTSQLYFWKVVSTSTRTST